MFETPNFIDYVCQCSTNNYYIDLLFTYIYYI